MNPKPIDELATYIDLMKTAQQDKARAQEIIDRCRELIEEALGDADTGTIDGHVAVTWKTVTSRRLNQGMVKTFLDESTLEQCMTTTTTRRFTLVGADE